MENIERVIFYTIDKAIKSYRQMAQQRLHEAGLDITVDQWLILNILKAEGDVSQQEIADRVFKDNASVTRIIELLVNKKYVSRKPSKEDRRRASLEITASGERLLKTADNIARSYRKKALKNIDQKTLESMRKGLTQIIENCES